MGTIVRDIFSIMSLELIRGKRAETTSHTLQDALLIAPSPYVLGSHNGGESLGRPFTEMLQLLDIQTWHNLIRQK
jgi:hypothetical protein